MRKPLVFVAVLAATVLGVPSAAQAHHLEQETSTIECVLSNNVPTVKVSAHYVDFAQSDLPVFWSTWIGSTKVGGGSLVWSGSDYRHNASFKTSAGVHTVAYIATWNSGANSAKFSKTVTCPTPVPPTVVVCNGTVMPPGTQVCPPIPPTFVCDGVVQPVGTVVCPTPPKKHHKRKKACVPKRDIIFHTVAGSGTRLGSVSLYVHGKKIRTKDGHYVLRSMRFGSVLLRNPGKDGRVAIKIIALLRKADGSALQFRVRDRVLPCGGVIRRDP